MKSQHCSKTEFGKVPPNDLEIERAVLGSYIIDSNSFLNNPVDPKVFYKEEHVKICECIKTALENGREVDLLILTRELTRDGLIDSIGGPMYLTSLISNIGTTAHIEHHTNIIKELFVKRSLISKSQELINSCYNDDSLDDVLKNVSNLGDCINESSSEKIVSSDNALLDLDKRVQDNQTRASGISGMGTGISKLDKFTRGLQKGDLVVIGAQSSQGKTSLALTIANNATRDFDGKIGMISLEMTNEQIMARMISQDSRLSSKVIMNDKLNKSEDELYRLGLKSQSNRNIHLVKNSSITIENLMGSIRKMKLKHNIDCAVIDFLQRIRVPKGYNKSDFYAVVSQKLKDLALEIDVCVVLVSQLNRDKERPEPTLDRLRGSGEIEEAADLILLIWRPETYDFGKIEYKGLELDSNGLAWLKIAKGRNVGIGKILLRFSKDITKFEDYEQDEIPHPDQRHEPQIVDNNAGLEGNGIPF